MEPHRRRGHVSEATSRSRARVDAFASGGDLGGLRPAIQARKGVHMRTDPVSSKAQARADLLAVTPAPD
jgi:hypothetical protein